MMEYQRGEYVISNDPSRLDLDTIHHFLSRESYWAKGVPFDIVQRSVQASLCFGMYHKGDGGEVQAGFARVISDYATQAVLVDVFVLPDYRGQGLGKWMLDCIFAHPDLQGLRLWRLSTRDAHSLYARYGFTPVAQPDKMMERLRPYLEPADETQS